MTTTRKSNGRARKLVVPPPASQPAPVRSDTGHGATAADDLDQVGKIRDILFGQQMLAYDIRFEQAEAKLAQGLDALRSETSRDFERLEHSLKQQCARIDERLAAMVAARESLAEELAAAESRQVSRITDLKTSLADTESALRKLIHAQVDKALDRLGQAEQQLISDKLNRGDLAEMLAGMAQSLQPAGAASAA